MKQQASTPSFNSLVAHLPKQAHSIYYRDQIGNISTSDMRLVDDGLELDIATRFPIFGGWKTQFYLGYSIPTGNILSVDSDTGRYKVKFDLYPVFEDVWVGLLSSSWPYQRARTMSKCTCQREQENGNKAGADDSPT